MIVELIGFSDSVEVRYNGYRWSTAPDITIGKLLNQIEFAEDIAKQTKADCCEADDFPIQVNLAAHFDEEALLADPAFGELVSKHTNFDVQEFAD